MTSEAEVVVFGLGYVGLPSAVLLAESGKVVLGVDTNVSVIEKLRVGELAIEEPGLASALREVCADGRLKFSDQAIPARVFLICVPTPLQAGQADLRFIEQVVSALAVILKAGDLVVLESTSPPGTTQRVEELLKMAGVETTDMYFAYCPERVLPGNALEEMRKNPRVIGGLTEEAAEVAASFYSSFSVGPLVRTSAAMAEVAKLVENSFRDVNAAFANEVSIIASSFGLNDGALIDLVNMHPRVNVLRPGVGVGGHCLPVDPLFLANSRPGQSLLIQTARKVNDRKSEWIVELVLEKAGAMMKRKGLKRSELSILCLGLSYKADSSDLRESRALWVYQTLEKLGFAMVASEPNFRDGDSIKVVNWKDGLDRADLVLGLVDHREFKDINFSQFADEFFLDFCGLTARGLPTTVD